MSEILGKTCIDGGKCHHACDKSEDQTCFRRGCCQPFSDYTGPWAYDASPTPPAAGGEMGENDKSVWTLIELAEAAGAVKDESDGGSFWTFNLDALYSLDRELKNIYATPVAAGGVVVPREATREMLNAAIDAHGHKLCEISALGFRISPQMMFAKSYAAMLAAAPQQSAQGGLRIRMHRGGLEAAMATAETLPATIEAVCIYLRAHGWGEADPSNTMTGLYTPGEDKRIGWSQTWWVKVDGCIAAFTDGPLPAPPKTAGGSS